ncbi:alpha/beta fold hydrolase [Granulicella cerasi]|uniref:Alpha/beta fold hydrolase n=1 Tax=Granulicella cerasi TaxID=741063 RepID=A0ABW1ZA18_9BACT|nr:alpha/beta hydrolase [Granulicella cerasi]
MKMNRREAVLGMLAAGAAVSGVAQTAPTPNSKPVHKEGGDLKVEINGATINYSMAGEHNEHPMIVLHGGRGFGTYPGVYHTYLPLAEKYRLIGFDMRGHGYSSLTPPYTFDQICDDIEQIRIKLGGGKKMVLLGGSFGGMIALSYAIKYPDSLSHLCLRGTTPSWRNEIGAYESFRKKAAEKAPMATEEMLRKIFTPTIIDDNEFRLIMYSLYPMYAPDDKPIDHNAILETARRGIYHAKVHNDLYADHSYDVIGKMGAIKVPTLVMCGEADWICTPDQSQMIAAEIKGSKLVIVPKSNHGVPDDIALKEVSTFLNETA